MPAAADPPDRAHLREETPRFGQVARHAVGVLAYAIAQMQRPPGLTPPSLGDNL